MKNDLGIALDEEDLFLQQITVGENILDSKIDRFSIRLQNADQKMLQGEVALETRVKANAAKL